MKSFLSVKQVVARLNGAVSVKLIYKLISLGRLRVNRETGKVLVEEESLIELMEGMQTAPAHAAAPRGSRRSKGRSKDSIELW